MTPWPVQRVAVVGPGLIGGSIGLGLRSAGFTGSIIGCARKARTLQTARDRGCIDIGTSDLSQACRDADLIVLCTPVGSLDAMLERVGPLNGEAVVTDAGSTKCDVVEAAQQRLVNPQRFIGAHPMAGAEQSGPEAARADLFAGKPCILTPTDDADPHALAVVETLWTMLGMKLLRMSPSEHDTATALFSHLPHALAVTLVGTVAGQSGWEVASTGFAGASRLASSNPPMRADIMQANRAALIEAIEACIGRLGELKQVLQADDRERLMGMLDHAKKVRDDWIADRSANPQ